jgi:translation initiation factor 1 (eIF-1/SUI1)
MQGVPGEEIESLLDAVVGEVRAVECRGFGAFAVGRMLMSGREIACAGGKGKLLEVLHHVGDAVWAEGDRGSVPAISGEKKPEEGPEEASAPADAADAAAAEVGDDEARMEAMDALAEQLFFAALATRVPKTSLPIQLPQLWALMLACRPDEGDGTFLDIKATRFKKLGRFVEAMMEERDACTVTEIAKGVHAITDVNRESREYVDMCEKLGLEDRVPSAPELPGSLKVTELVQPHSGVRPLFEQFGAPLDEGVPFTRLEQLMLSRFTVDGRLAGSGKKRTVVLDETARDCLFPKDGILGEPVPYPDLVTRLMAKITPSYRLSSASGQEILVKKGNPPTIRIKVLKRASNKFVTTISHVQGYGVQPEPLAQELAVICAASASTQEDPDRSIGTLVVVQGSPVPAILDHLTTILGIPERFIQADKPKRKK